MSPTETITLLIATAALVTSGVSAYEMVVQRKNAVRPVLVLLDKQVDNADPSKGRAIYLVNMGQAVAVDIKVVGAQPDHLAEAAKKVMREIASGRRSKLREYPEGQETPFHHAGTYLRVRYFDVNANEYETVFKGGKHAFRRIGLFGRSSRRQQAGG